MRLSLEQKPHPITFHEKEKKELFEMTTSYSLRDHINSPKQPHMTTLKPHPTT